MGIWVREKKVNNNNNHKLSQDQALQTQKLIKEQFEQLHDFLNQEESKRISAVKREEEMKMGGIKDKIKELSAEVQTLTETISVIQDQLKEDDVLLLKVCIMENDMKKQTPGHQDLDKKGHCFISLTEF